MTKNRKQTELTLRALPAHFSPDPHLAVAGATVDGVRIIPGETELEDILVVTYQGLPALSFYDVYGRLIDVDHYLPDSYVDYDALGAEALLDNLRITDRSVLTDASRTEATLGEIYDSAEGNLSAGLAIRYGLSPDVDASDRFLRNNKIDPSRGIRQITDRFKTMHAFLVAYLSEQYAGQNHYVHFTARDSIIITPLDRRSGLAVLIETRDEQNKPLQPVDWRITRTGSKVELDKALVFRTEDIRSFFASTGAPPLVTERYEMTVGAGNLSLDSLLDDTDNVLDVRLHNRCYQVLSSDPGVVLALSAPREVTVVNTHRSVVPQKWVEKIKLPEPAEWVRADENLSVLFCLLPGGTLVAYDVVSPATRELARDTTGYAANFGIDQTGGLTLVTLKDNRLVRLATNVNELELPGREVTFTAVFKNLSDLFRGESLFERAVYATPINVAEEATEENLPSAIEVARFDFGTNVDHLLAEAGEDYAKLLEVREKIAIARRNIEEEFSAAAEREGVRLVGQRLQQTVNNIVRPVERRVIGLLEATRSAQLLEQAEKYQTELRDMSDPGAYRDVINALREADDELGRMDPANVRDVLPRFKKIQAELNALFSKQIAEDGNALQQFITQEIEQIEEAIAHTYEARRLESLLSTNPAALELFALLKQPFVLQSVAAERALSPAGIQQRLHEAVNQRLNVLREEAERKEAERQAAKVQFGQMIRDAIDFFIENHTGGFSDLELSRTAAYQTILADITKLQNNFSDTRLASELRQRLERVILDRNRQDLERAVAYEGKYAFVQNDPDLYVDLESTVRRFPEWHLEMIERPGEGERYLATFVRETDREVFRPSTNENLASGRAFEVDGQNVADYLGHYERYVDRDNELAILEAAWKVHEGKAKVADYPQFREDRLQKLLPEDQTARRALGAAREKKRRDRLERTRDRNVPTIAADFIDETPYFQAKLREFFIKAKLQLGTGSGVLLLSGPPSTGKSAFLKFAAALMNREYFEHASDKWQTKNSLVTAVRFGERGPYTTPAGFTRAITTGHSLLNIEEIKEWPEALRKSLNPFFAGSSEFIAPDGTKYPIGDNLLLCAAANLGAMYRQEDEAFTADFWSRIEVVEYDYAPHTISEEYYAELHTPVRNNFLTMQELVRHEFRPAELEGDPELQARTLSQRLLNFLLLPKADDRVKRDRLSKEINVFFTGGRPAASVFSPEEAAKVALRRVKDLQGFSAAQFFDLYDHFVNGKPPRSPVFAAMQTKDAGRYRHLRVVFLSLYYLEGCLRHVRELFQRSAGQSEIEGTNREFIGAVYLLGLLGQLGAE